MSFKSVVAIILPYYTNSVAFMANLTYVNVVE